MKNVLKCQYTVSKINMKKSTVSIKTINKAVTQSSKMEGLSFRSAKNNKKMIHILKSYGRAFAVSRQR